MTRAMVRKATINLLLFVFLGFLTSNAFAQPTLSFDDVPDDHWAASSVERLRSVGMLEGFPDGAYYGNLALSRYQMAVLLDRMLDLAKQEAQSEGLSIGEITALQQQIDQLNTILSQSVQSLIAPNLESTSLENPTNRTQLNVPTTNTQQDASSRSALITPASPVENYYQGQQNSTQQNVTQQNQAESLSSFDTQPNDFGQQNAEDIIARYEASPSALEYQKYLDAYMAAYGSSEYKVSNEQQVNRVGVVPSNAGTGSPLLLTTNAANNNATASTSVNIQPQSQQYAQQFAEQYQLQAQQPPVEQSAQQAVQQQIPLGYVQDQTSAPQANLIQPITQQTNQLTNNQQTTVQSNNTQTSQAQTENQNIQNNQVVKSVGVYLQLGAFANLLSAESLNNELQALGFPAMQQENEGLYKVLVGPFDFVTVQTATEALSAQGYSFFMLR